MTDNNNQEQQQAAAQSTAVDNATLVATQQDYDRTFYMWLATILFGILSPLAVYFFVNKEPNKSEFLFKESRLCLDACINVAIIYIIGAVLTSIIGTVGSIVSLIALVYSLVLCFRGFMNAKKKVANDNKLILLKILSK